jgi:adenylate cyclase
MTVESNEVDFAAHGLLDGLEGGEREARRELLAGLLERGATLAELRQAVAEDRLVLLPLERILGGRYAIAEVSKRSGVPAEQLRRAWRALGFVPRDDEEERAFTDEDVAAARSLKAFLDAGLSEDSLLDIARVLGEGSSRLSSAVTSVFVETYLEPGDSERDVALRFAVMAKQLLPLMAPVLDAALQGHVREATRRGIIGRAERERGKLATAEEVVVCFADLVGFTSLGGEVGAEELGLVARRLGELAAEAASPTVRLVKTIGDAAMYVSQDAAATVNAALELVDAVSEADLPVLRAGIASGQAFNRAGDWYGQSVNLASRVTGVARPGSVLCTQAVRECAPAEFWWSAAGRFRLKGLPESVPLYRARRPARREPPGGEDRDAARRRRAGRSRRRVSR